MRQKGKEATISTYIQCDPYTATVANHFAWGCTSIWLCHSRTHFHAGKLRCHMVYSSNILDIYLDLALEGALRPLEHFRTSLPNISFSSFWKPRNVFLRQTWGLPWPQNTVWTWTEHSSGRYMSDVKFSICTCRRHSHSWFLRSNYCTVYLILFQIRYVRQGMIKFCILERILLFGIKNYRILFQEVKAEGDHIQNLKKLPENHIYKHPFIKF